MRLRTLYVFFWLASLAALATAQSLTPGCAPTGNMPFPGGSEDCPTDARNAPPACPATPTYDTTKPLWPCPWVDSNDPEACCGGDSLDICASCDPMLGDCSTDPLCFPGTSGMLETGGVCRPLEGCFITPEFNWIIGACQGSNCGDYSDSTAKNLRRYKNRGTRAILNYVAAYRFDADQKIWVLEAPSSFNTDGAKGAYDLIQPWGGLGQDDAWLSPQPGGAGGWGWGYYPAGVEGLGAPAMLFVISTELSWNFTWYMLNKVTLDRGPTVSYPSEDCPQTNLNCWDAGNAGEIDFLQPPWTTSSGTADNYRRLYATSNNENGRCFSGSMGETCQAGGQFGNVVTTNSYFLGSGPDKPEPYIFAAVVDQIGTFIYRIPSGESARPLWLAPGGSPGLSRKTAACQLKSRPELRPPNGGPPCDETEPYCALFLPNCQATRWGGADSEGASNEGCYTNPHQGFGKNWFRNFVDTEQWQWPENGNASVVNFRHGAVPPQTMPWNYEMEAWLVDWNGNPVVNPECCTEGKGYCPHLWQQVSFALEADQADSGGCFGFPWNRAKPERFRVPFDPIVQKFTYTDPKACPKTTEADERAIADNEKRGCVPGPNRDYANHCRRCTLDPKRQAEGLPLCPDGYGDYIRPGIDVPSPPGNES